MSSCRCVSELSRERKNTAERFSVSLQAVKLHEFRNYAHMSLTLRPAHVVLTGDNGAGKTNLLEAISFLSPGRGLRRARYSAVSRATGDTGFSVFAAAQGLAGPVEIGTGLVATGGEAEGYSRVVRIDGANAASAEALLEHLRISWLTPAMDGLFTGAAGDRRRFLDRLVLAVSPGHGRLVIDYDRALRSRNRLLAEGSENDAWLTGIETQIAEKGMALDAGRRETLSLLKAMIAETPGSSPFPRADMELEPFLPGPQLDSAQEHEIAFERLLFDARRADRAAGRTLNGPHRSDLLVRHAPKDMPAALCSTGEQKALLIGLILAHARLVGNISGGPPLLLLDEVAAHLDEHRRSALFSLIGDIGSQAIMTGTDSHLFDALKSDAQFFTVADGNIRGSQKGAGSDG